MNDPEPLYDIHGIPLREFDVYRIEHFRTSRRRIAYLYKVAVIIDGRWYGQDLRQVVMNQHDKLHRYRIGNGDTFEIIDGQLERLPCRGIECFWERKRRKTITSPSPRTNPSRQNAEFPTIPSNPAQLNREW